jgi:hypothetical protein
VVFITEMQYIYCAVGIEAFHKVRLLAVLKELTLFETNVIKVTRRFPVSITPKCSKLSSPLCYSYGKKKRVNHSKVSGKTGEKSTFTEKFVMPLPRIKENTDIIATELVLRRALSDPMYEQLLDRTGQ